MYSQPKNTCVTEMDPQTEHLRSSLSKHDFTWTDLDVFKYISIDLKSLKTQVRLNGFTYT